MNIKKFMDENMNKLLPETLAKVNSHLVLYSVRGVEPTFLMMRKSFWGKPAWVLTFGDDPTFWLAMFQTKQEFLDFCDKYELSLIKPKYDH